MKIFLKL